MSAQAAFFVGHGIIVLLLGTVLFLPNSWLGRELRRAYQVQTTGVLGRFAARDFGRAALMSLVIGLLLLGASVAAYAISFQKQDGTLDLVLEGYGFGFFLLGTVVLLSIIQTLWRGLRVWRRESRLARLCSTHAELFTSIREILERHNVMDLDREERETECSYEAARLLVPVIEVATYEELLGCVHAQFVMWFTPYVAGPRERFAAVTQELWNLRSAARAA